MKANAIKTYAIKIYGIVQGVGFRPFVYNKAREFKIFGWVKNSGGIVELHCSGEANNIKSFVLAIYRETPSNAKIERIQCMVLEDEFLQDFVIKESVERTNDISFIVPDLGSCSKCIEETLEQQGMRKNYAFTNCTECGPRYSIIKSLPYDRNSTTMNDFKMCASCREEYEGHSSRRFHAETNCCKECGPSLILMNNKLQHINSKDVIEETIALLQQGKILAVKGIGGFHLLCDGRNEKSIERLRIKKNRPDKPLALMVKNSEVVGKFCYVSEAQKKLLENNKKPIVLLKKKKEGELPPNIAPSQSRLGVMLPYTPLYYLLFKNYLDILVATSGNLSNTPIQFKNREAMEHLKGVADYFLIHNRDIYIPVEDSVVKVVKGEQMILRLGRGYAPYSQDLKLTHNVLALGGEQKASFAISKNGYGYMSQYLNNITNLDSYKSYHFALKHLCGILGIKPKIFAYDLHPNYITTKYINGIDGRKIGVQHHHAHMVSCMAEHNIFEKSIGVIYDGTGIGTDNSIWGGEFFLATRDRFERVAHLQEVSIQGGDKSIEEPWRCAASYLYALGYEIKYFIKGVEEEKLQGCIQALSSNLNCYRSSSMGRLFDCISSLIGLRNYITFDAQAAIELENIMDNGVHKSYEYKIDDNEMLCVRYEKIIKGVLEDIQLSTEPSVISAKFHNTIVSFTCSVVCQIRKKYGINLVILSGGVFENGFLLEAIIHSLEEKKFKVVFNKKIPINDGGISFGQLAIADSIINEEEKKHVYCSAR